MQHTFNSGLLDCLWRVNRITLRSRFTSQRPGDLMCSFKMRSVDVSSKIHHDIQIPGALGVLMC